jgi:hypothetical protein
MLKISIENGKGRRLLVLEGKLIAPWTSELRNVCQGITSDHDERELVLDVRGITDISPDGEEVLYCLMVQGAKFRGSGVFMKQVLRQLTQRMGRNDRP